MSKAPAPAALIERAMKAMRERPNDARAEIEDIVAELKAGAIEARTRGEPAEGYLQAAAFLEPFLNEEGDRAAMEKDWFGSADKPH